MAIGFYSNEEKIELLTQTIVYKDYLQTVSHKLEGVINEMASISQMFCKEKNRINQSDATIDEISKV